MHAFMLDGDLWIRSWQVARNGWSQRAAFPKVWIEQVCAVPQQACEEKCPNALQMSYRSALA